jgi:hypothetical protein
MSKSSSGGLFGRRDASTIAIVDAPVTQSYVRKARVAFYVVGVSVAIVSAVILSHDWHPILGALAGMFIGVVAGLIVGSVVLVWPVLRALWHWSAEIALVPLLLYAWTALMQATNTLVSLLVVALLVGVPAAIGPVRRRIVALVWCQIWRHRLRLAFAQIIRTGNRHQPGQVPFILQARPTPAGGRVWVWLRPGLSLEDLEGKTSALAVACWAAEARIVRASSRYAALVRVDFVRRDPLTTVVTSPLPALVPDGVWDAPALVPPAVAATGLNLDQIPEDLTDPSSGPRDSRRR